MGRATHHGEAQSHPVHLTGLLFLHPEMGAPESVRSTERPSLKSMPFQPGQQKQTSQCDVSKAKNSSQTSQTSSGQQQHKFPTEFWAGLYPRTGDRAREKIRGLHEQTVNEIILCLIS